MNDIETWHARAAGDVVTYWQTSLTSGLSTDEAATRLQQFGPNKMRELQKTPWWQRFFAQFQDFMVLVLLAATLISALLSEFTDAITILAIVFINAILGFMQEYKAEQSVLALAKMTAPTGRVLRNGTIQKLPAEVLVPGDLLVLETGDRVAADARLIESYNLEVEEAMLTGESLPVKKAADKVYLPQTPLGDRRNMVYMGTNVTRGRGLALICATGMRTEIGAIADLIAADKKEETPLERRLDHLGRWLVWGCLTVCAVVVFTGVLRGEALFLMCLTGISLAVAAIPEGLPAIVTVSLALGVQRMIKRNAIVRKLPAVETLGCTTVICSDKTGTLTQNAMTVTSIVTAENEEILLTGTGYDIKGRFIKDGRNIEPDASPSLRQALLIGAICNNCQIKKNEVAISGLWRKQRDKGWSIEGDPTEGALLVAAAKAGIWREQMEKQLPRIGEIPFETFRRRMSVLCRDERGEGILFVKGAPDMILALCQYRMEGNKTVPLTADSVATINAAVEKMTSEALRVLAVAYRRVDKAELANLSETMERELVFAGLLGMIDPPRDEVKKAVVTCRQAGIKSVMITGDHRNTAVAIATAIGIYREGKEKVLTGLELDAMSDDALAAVVNDTTVYARVSPVHKLRIVKALKQNGHIVAMTGDGVNDAPAVREADIGVAMGRAGTDVTKQAAAMVLTDDNFATIVAAVEEGRAIYDNIRKFIRYLLACNTGEVLTMFISALLGIPLPLLPVQILWVNLVTDGLPAMALGVDKADPHLMLRPPRSPRENIFSRGLGKKIVLRGLQIGLSTVFVFVFVYRATGDLATARTAAFSTLVFSQLFHVFDCRSEVFTPLEIGLFTNKHLLAAAATSTLMLLAVIYVPFLRGVFKTAPLSGFEWLLIVVVAGWTFILTCVRHLLFRRRAGRQASVFNRA